MQVDTLSTLVDRKLRLWAYEISGGGSITGGYPTINILHPMAGVASSSAPDVSDETMLTEMVLNEARKEARDPIIVVRAAYLCQSTFIDRQRKRAQWELGYQLGRRRFLTLFDSGFAVVRDFFAFDQDTVDPWTAWLHRHKQTA